MSVDAQVPYQPQPPQTYMRQHGRHSAVVGATLIVTGVLLLGVRLLPQVSLAAAWPLFFFVVGIVQMVTPEWDGTWKARRFAEGLGTLLFGAALLGCTLGLVEWGMWLTMLSLWPLLLVVGGLNLLSKSSGQSWLAGAATLVVWATLVFAAAGAWTGSRALTPVPPVFDRQSLESPDATARAAATTIVDAVTEPLSRVTY